MNFECIEVDQSVLKWRTTRGECFLGFYVDDILMASRNITLIQNIKKAIKQKCKVIDMGEAKNFLGVTVHIKITKRTLEMDQVSKIHEYHTKPGVTHNERNTIPVSVPLGSDETKENLDHGNYQKIVGQVQYLSGTTRRDIVQPTSVLGRYSMCASTALWRARRGTLKYLKASKQPTMQYTTSDENPIKTEGYHLQRC